MIRQQKTNPASSDWLGFLYTRKIRPKKEQYQIEVSIAAIMRGIEARWLQEFGNGANSPMKRARGIYARTPKVVFGARSSSTPEAALTVLPKRMK
jgi:hypothetical protein